MPENFQTEPEKFSDSGLDDLSALIAKLPKVVETRLQVSRIFCAIHKKLNRGLHFEEILDSLFTSLEKVIPFDRIGIATLEKDGSRIRLNWVKSKMRVNSLIKNYSASMKDSSLSRLITDGQPRIIEDFMIHLSEHPKSQSTKLALEDGIRSNLTFPIMIDGKTAGVVFFSSLEPCTYKSHHIALFSEVAEGVALIVEQGILKQSVSEINLKEKIFRNVIHDINNPLTIIQGTLELIFKKKWYQDLGDDAKKVFSTLKRNTESMINLVDDLTHFDLHLPSSSKYFAIRLHPFLHEFKSDCEMMGLKKNIHFSLNISPDLPDRAFFDHFKIKEALDNIISNATKYSEKGSSVTIEVGLDCSHKRLYFSVTDQGIGIPDEEQKHLFKEFGKTSNIPTDGEISRGLGLANVKRLIEAHEGQVFVDSKAGVGSTFGFWIPFSTVDQSI